jgi:hypothetical protein
LNEHENQTYFFKFFFQYEKDESRSSSSLFKVDNSLAFANITSRHTPVQSITVAPMQLTTLKQSSTTDPVLSRLEKNGFATSSNSRPASAVPVKRSSVKPNHFFF